MADKIVVAVIGNEGDMGELLNRLRNEPDYEPQFCPFGPETFGCIKDMRPAVVVIDLTGIQTPDRDLISVIKTDPTLSVTPVVLCAPFTPDVQQLLEQLALQRLYVVNAPCSIDQILQQIARAAGKG